MLKVRNMISTKSDRPVINQFIIEDTERNRVAFQSYESPIVLIDNCHDTIVVYKDWNYSTTTSIYRNKFMEEQGLYELANTKALKKAMEAGTWENFTILKAF
jgi:hypothetical protein